MMGFDTKRRWTLLALAAAWLRPARAAAANPIEARSVADALQRLGIASVADSPGVVLDVPDIAENGAVVPVTVRSTLPDTSAILVLLEKNPFPLAARYELLEGVAPEISMRVKMAETADVIALVQAGGQVFRARREVKVTIGGCGG